MSEIKLNGKLSWIDDAIKLGTTLSKSWFRGHPELYENLTPGAYREENTHFLTKDSQEAVFAEHFKRQASAYSSYTPEDLDHLEWLFLMQHHGTPTRLLDWSENVLVALYFTVRDKFNEDGELWAIYPNELNQISINHSNIALSRNKYVKYLAGEPFHNDLALLKHELKLTKVIKGPLAFYPPMRFQRMINQLSAFTIHPDPEVSSTIPGIISEEQHIVRYIIPKGRKQDLLNKLHSLGIRENTLFPNLDSLSKSIQQEMKTVAYSPPTPPALNDV